MDHTRRTTGIHALSKCPTYGQVSQFPFQDVHFLPILMTCRPVRRRVYPSVIASQAGVHSRLRIIGEPLFPDAGYRPGGWRPDRGWLMKLILRFCHTEGPLSSLRNGIIDFSI